MPESHTQSEQWNDKQQAMKQESQQQSPPKFVASWQIYQRIKEKKICV